MKYMDKEQFMNKWMDTHTEFQVIDHINKKHMRKIEATKRQIEIESAEDRVEKLSQFLVDAVAARKDEVLDPNKLPIKDLLNATIRSHPQRAKVENTGTVNFTFADMISRASINLEKVNTIDAEDSDD